MLTDQDKERILLEETYRREVREQFETHTAPKSVWERVSPILNSAFTIWFLSSIVLSVVGFLYTKWDVQRVGEREKRVREAQIKRDNELVVRKLDAEIANRLIVFTQLNTIAVSSDNDVLVYLVSEANVEAIARSLSELENPSLGEYKISVFPEYANRSLRSLLFELKEIVPNVEREEIDNAYNKSLVLLELYLRTHDSAIKNFQTSPRAMLGILAPRRGDLGEVAFALNLKRWNQPFTWSKEFQKSQ